MKNKKLYSSLAIVGIATMVTPLAIAQDTNTPSNPSETVSVEKEKDSTKEGDNQPKTPVTEGNETKNTESNDLKIPEGMRVVRKSELKPSEDKCIDAELTSKLEKKSASEKEKPVETGEPEGDAKPKESTDSPSDKSENKPSDSNGKEESSGTETGSANTSQYASENANETAIKVVRPTIDGNIINNILVKGIQIVESEKAEGVTVKGLPEGLEFNTTNGSVTGTPSIEFKNEEKSKTFELEFDGTDNPLVNTIIVHRDDNKNGIADEDEKEGNLTLNFAYENGELAISTPSGTAVTEKIGVDEEGYLINEGKRVKGDNGEEIRVLKDNKLARDSVIVPVHSKSSEQNGGDANEKPSKENENPDTQNVVVNLGCLASLKESTPSWKFPQIEKNHPTTTNKGDSKKTGSGEGSTVVKNDTESKDGSNVLSTSGSANDSRKLDGYYNGSEKYEGKWQNLNAGGRLINGGNGEAGPKVETGGHVRVGLVTNILNLLR